MIWASFCKKAASPLPSPVGKGVPTVYVSCLSNSKKTHLYARFALITSFTIMFAPATLTANAQSVTVG